MAVLSCLFVGLFVGNVARKGLFFALAFLALTSIQSASCFAGERTRSTQGKIAKRVRSFSEANENIDGAIEYGCRNVYSSCACLEKIYFSDTNRYTDFIEESMKKNVSGTPGRQLTRKCKLVLLIDGHLHPCVPRFEVLRCRRHTRSHSLLVVLVATGIRLAIEALAVWFGLFASPICWCVQWSKNWVMRQHSRSHQNSRPRDLESARMRCKAEEGSETILKSRGAIWCVDQFISLKTRARAWRAQIDAPLVTQSSLAKSRQ